ncbi:peptidylprolyl isomerase [Haloferula sargassicola]|uniref:Chaperone SurA n=1 Tax=Haloferula sargassicola TaxID=490096 RepID=A0ABP9UIG1_9BACT
MRPSRKFTVRIFLYSAVLAYLAADLLWFDGPVSQRVRRSMPGSTESIQSAKNQGVVARAFKYPIYLSQVERAMQERLWLEGKSAADLTPEQRHDARLAALNDLIDHELLRTKVQANQNDLPVSDQEIDDAVRRLASRFATREEMKAELAAEGIDSEKELRFRLAARLQQVKYIETRIAKDVAVSDDEAREWFAVNADKLAIPPRVHVRHVFLATLGVDPQQVRKKLDAAVARITSGAQTFEAVAGEISDDPRSKPVGGDLGWVTEDRLPADFATPVFRMQPGQPEIIRTKLGWHYVEVLEKRPRELRSFDEAKDEVIAALRSAKRAERVNAQRQAIRNTQKNVAVHVYYDMIPTE